MAEDCRRCNRPISQRDGDDPTEICDYCAHELVEILTKQLQVLADAVKPYYAKHKVDRCSCQICEWARTVMAVTEKMLKELK